MEYVFRPPRDSEAEQLLALHRESMGAYIEATYGPWDEDAQRGILAERLVRPELKVVEVAGAIAGILEVTRREDCYYVDNIQLAAAFRRKGLGAHLLSTIMERAAEERVPVRLTVLLVNPARSLYERLGFREVSLTATHHHMRWDPPG